MPKVYTRLVLSGGETKGLAQLGALHYFWKNKQLNHQTITHYAGASVGSLIGLLLVCGYTPFEIWTHVYSADSLFSLNLPISPTSLFNSYGLMSIDGVIGKVRELVESRYGRIPTMLELYDDTQKTFIISVTNLTEQHVEYCSYLSPMRLFTGSWHQLKSSFHTRKGDFSSSELFIHVLRTYLRITEDS